jgi:hypothetical protein
MNGKSPNQLLQFLFGMTLAGMILVFYFGISTSSAVSAHEVGTATPTDTTTPTKTLVETTAPESNDYYTVNTVNLSDGTIIEEDIINGPPEPPPGFEVERQSVSLPEPDSAAGINILTVPAFNWVFGCSAVSGAMIAGYYDRSGWSNMYTGPTNGGFMPLDNSSWPTWSDGFSTYPSCPLIASRNGVDGLTTRGSIDDYWVQYNSTASDPYIGHWTQHTWGDAIGDYMKTSQSAYSNVDGSTSFWNYSSATPFTCSEMEASGITDDGTDGRKLFYQARGYTVTDCYNQKTDNRISGGFSFAQYKAEIDAGRPVMLNLAGHTVVGVGYDDSTNTVYLHDTWDYLTHTMTWGGSYSGMNLQSVSIVNLASLNAKTLSVTKAGTGSGIVTSSPAGINCGSTCSYDFAYSTVVTLTASPASNFNRFVNWGGDAGGSSNPIQITMTQDWSVAAIFEHATFSDVPFTYTSTLGGISYPLHDYIQALYDGGYTAGCGTNPLRYCPDNTLTRAESAVFMLRGMEGVTYTPPTDPSGYVFTDDWSSPTISWGRPWAEGMWDESLTAGCSASPLMFCPARQLTRAEASVFGLRIEYGVSYTPPAASHIFADDWSSPGVSWAEPWAEKAYLDGLLPACGTSGGKPLFCPSDLITRAWGAYLIVKAKGLPMP